MSISHSPSIESPAGRRADESGQGEATDAPDLRLVVFALFFIFGGITSLNDVLIPKLKGLFTLTNGDVMLVQSAFFAAYFIISLPAAAVVRRFGYMRTAVFGLMMMTAGCLLFIPASSFGVFGVFLAALFVLAAGVTIIQVVANPLISMLGAARTAHSRLTFAQAFNSLGTTIFPYVGSILILRSLSTANPSTLDAAALSALRSRETPVIAHTYLGIAAVLVLLAAVVWLRRNRLKEVSDEDHSVLGHPFALLRRRRFRFGALCIFLYVGAEVAIGSSIVLYLMQTNVLGLGAEAAGKHVPFYWGGAMLGRFAGAYLLRVFSPGKILAADAAIVIALLVISANTEGAISGWTLLAVGLFNSIMFPTIFSLACEGLGPRAAEGSGIICMAIVGGAIVPWITGHAADWHGWRFALTVPALCYAGIMSFGMYARRPYSSAQDSAA
ncbi:MAG TPA: sugar MFS transporter [Steroidobacteraceae bacterium]|jgi:FHS family L-fucose permease-like MFS transporter|nr:sugar MFS transporter [Steroidobacteraceae bacterium]